MSKLPKALQYYYDVVLLCVIFWFFRRNIIPNYLVFFWLNKIAKINFHLSNSFKILSETLRPWDLKNKKKRSRVQTLWSAVQTSASPLPMSLTWGSQWLVRSSLLLCFKNKIKQNKINFIIGHTIRPHSTSTIKSFHWNLNNKP